MDDDLLDIQGHNLPLIPHVSWSGKTIDILFFMPKSRHGLTWETVHPA